jgi:hypothetical protein
VPLADSLARLGREAGDFAEAEMLRREGVSLIAIYRLRWELDMLKHALYLNRNEPLFRMVRDGREHAIFGNQPWKK